MQCPFGNLHLRCMKPVWCCLMAACSQQRAGDISRLSPRPKFFDGLFWLFQLFFLDWPPETESPEIWSDRPLFSRRSGPPVVSKLVSQGSVVDLIYKAQLVSEVAWIWPGGTLPNYFLVYPPPLSTDCRPLGGWTTIFGTVIIRGLVRRPGVFRTQLLERIRSMDMVGVRVR